VSVIHVNGYWSYTSGESICPDLLRLEQIGEADGWRGRLVRVFFWVLDRIAPVRLS
jgi:hypothetical protein